MPSPSMRSPAEVSADMLRLVQPLPPVEMALDYTRGCVLAEDIVATVALPAFDNSAMDGYAVRAVDVAGASAQSPVSLRVLADAAAGAVDLPEVTAGTTVRIMTGAPMPAGADTVVRVEDTDGDPSTVAVFAPSPVGKHIRRAGEDIEPGTRVLRAGELLGPRQLAIAAAVGRGLLRVHPQPTIAVVPTGSELTKPGTPLPPGAIYDSNGHLLAACVDAMGARVVRYSAVADEPHVFRAAIKEAARNADLIVTSGGVSMGAYDTAKAVLSELGTVRFEKVAMNPGMPQGFGRVHGDTPIITLPGNPVSSYVSFEVFVRPVIRALQGRRDVRRPVRTAIATEGFESPAAKEQYVRAVVSATRGRPAKTGSAGLEAAAQCGDVSGVDSLTVAPIGMQGSHVLGGLAAANALIVVPIGVDRVNDGDAVSIIDLREP